MKSLPSLKILILLFCIFATVRAVPSFGQDNIDLGLDTVHIVVDMNYAVDIGKFRPEKDTFEMKGTMTTGWIKMDSIGPGYTYKMTYRLQNEGLHFVELRIRAQDSIITTDTAYLRDTTYYETVNRATRYFRVGDSTQTVKIVYNNHFPGFIPMVFNCNLYLQIYNGAFDPAINTIDVKGNFNNWGATKMELFPLHIDSIYSATLYVDSTAIPTDSLQFKFRLNGDDSTEESMTRSYLMTISAHQFSCWYNDVAPIENAPPFVSNVHIQDSIYSKHTVTGVYQYNTPSLKAEGESKYQWYYASEIGGALTEIDSAWSVNYTIDSLLIGKYLIFEVTPVTVDTVAGETVQVWSDHAIFGVGLDDLSAPFVNVYPNPFENELHLDFFTQPSSVELLNSQGEVVISTHTDFPKLQLQLDRIESGLYFLKVTDKHNQIRVNKLIKL